MEWVPEEEIMDTWEEGQQKSTPVDGDHGAKVESPDPAPQGQREAPPTDGPLPEQPRNEVREPLRHNNSPSAEQRENSSNDISPQNLWKVQSKNNLQHLPLHHHH